MRIQIDRHENCNDLEWKSRSVSC